MGFSWGFDGFRLGLNSMGVLMVLWPGVEKWHGGLDGSKFGFFLKEGGLETTQELSKITFLDFEAEKKHRFGAQENSTLQWM